MIKFVAFCICIVILPAAAAEIWMLVEGERIWKELRRDLEEIENQRRKKDG